MGRLVGMGGCYESGPTAAWSDGGLWPPRGSPGRRHRARSPRRVQKGLPSQPSVLSPVPGAYRSEGWESLPELSPDPPAASRTGLFRGHPLRRGIATRPRSPPAPLLCRTAAPKPRKNCRGTSKPGSAPSARSRAPSADRRHRPQRGWTSSSQLSLLLASAPATSRDATCSDGRGGRL